MTLILWLIAGIAAGALAKAAIPRMSRDNWIFALFVAVVGSMAGGFAASLSGLGTSAVGNMIVAFAGGIIVLFFYRQYIDEVVDNKTA